MRTPRFFSGVFLILVLIFAVFFFRNEVLSFLGLVRSLDYEKLEAARLENLVLRTELEALKEKEADISGDSLAVAKVYSRYPFNDRREISIDLGENDGIREGMPVLAREGVLLGRVKSVFGRQSLVETVFDPAWRSSVTLGGETKALLEGGHKPTLTLIARDSAVSSGSPVLNTSPEFPLGLVLGEVGEVRPASDDIWLVAELETLYSPENLSEVFVVTNFP